MFDVSSGQSIESWYPILNWKSKPNFSDCHVKGTDEEFRKDYYVSNELIVIYKNILDTLDTDQKEYHNIRITGDPGAGKTSFIYALKHMSENGYDILKDHIFYIFHANRAEPERSDKGNGDPNYLTTDDEILYRIREAWKVYFLECGHIDKYNDINNEEISVKEKNKRLSNFYLQNKAGFDKTLNFILDDLDMLSSEDVSYISGFAIKNLELRSVKKWIILRDSTYDEYSGKTRGIIEQFYPDSYKFPIVSLYEIIKHRISKGIVIENDEPSPKNPFSKKLCDEIILPLMDGCMRESLSMLKTILQECHPKNIDHSKDELFISNYIEKASINTLLSSKKLKNLHLAHYRPAFYPVAIDLLCCCLYHSDYRILYGGLNDCAIDRDSRAKYQIGNKDKKYVIREQDFKFVIDALVDNGLMTFDISKKRLFLTRSGRLHASYVNRHHYYEYSKAQAFHEDETYWKLSKVSVDHKEIIATYVLWKKLQ